MNKTNSLLIIGLVLFLTVSFFPKVLSVIDDNLMLNALTYKPNSYYSWSALQGFGYPYSNKNVTTNGSVFQFDATSFGGNPITYSFKTTFRLYSDGADYSGPANFFVDSVGSNGLYLTKASSSMYHCAIIVGNHVISSIDLNFSQYYDCFLLLLFNNTDTHTYPTFAENFTVYSQNHLNDSAFQIGSIFSAYSSVGQVWSSYIQTSIGTVGAWGGGISNIFIYQEQPPFVISTSSTPINGTVTWTDGVAYNFPQNFSALLGVTQTISATVAVSDSNSSNYLFEGWSIDGSSTLNTSNPLVFSPTADMTLEAVYSLVEITDYSSTVTFGIGLFGFILIGLSWVVGYHFYKEGDYRSMFFWGFLMLIFGYGLIWVIFGG